MKRVNYIRLIGVITVTIFNMVLSQDICSNTWVTYPKQNILGGFLDPASKSLDSCRESCLSYSNSIGYDFDGDNRCWINFDGDISQHDNSQFVTHYELLRGVNSCNAKCNGKSSYAWVVSMNTNSPGGTENTTANSKTACLQACRDSDACLGFDWDSSSKKCFLSTSNTKNSANGVIHYDRFCQPTGYNIQTPSFIRTPGGYTSTPFSQVTSRSAEDSVNIYVMGQAIKPAYIVLAGLGAGCIILVIIAICVLCLYPLRGTDDGYQSKKTKKQKGELHTRRPKTLSDEEHGMSTMTTAVQRNSYDRHSYNNSTHKSSNHNTHVSNGSVGKYDKRPDSDEYKPRDSGEYNKRDSVGSIRKSGGYEEMYNHHDNDRESMVDRTHDKAESILDEVRDKGSYIHEEYN